MTPEQLDKMGIFASDAHSIAAAIYNSVRMVGNKKLTADQALHLLVEYEHRAHELGDAILELKHELQDGGAK